MREHKVQAIAEIIFRNIFLNDGVGNKLKINKTTNGEISKKSERPTVGVIIIVPRFLIQMFLVGDFHFFL